MIAAQADFEMYFEKEGYRCFMHPALKLRYFQLPISQKHMAFLAHKATIHSDAEGLKNEIIQAQHIGLQPIIVWQDDWELKRNLVLSRIASLEGLNAKIHARKCTVKRISKDVSAPFLNQNHLMGNVASGFQYGLFFEDDLIAVATFSKARTMNYTEPVYRSAELYRFATKQGFTIQGGLSKLLKNFVLEQKIDHLMTYTEMMWGEGSSFLKLGFHCSEMRASIAYQVVDNKREKLKSLEKSEGIVVYNAGSYKYVKSYQSGQ